MKSFQYSLAQLLDEIGEDSNREGLQKTPYRVEKAFKEMTQGYGENPADALSVTFESENEAPVTLKNIRFSSLCEHHMMPFFGTVDITYKPKKRVVGISKLARVVRIFSKRLQIQEKLTHEIADSIAANLGCEWVEVTIKATHTCIMCRGAESLDAELETKIKICN